MLEFIVICKNNVIETAETAYLAVYVGGNTNVCNVTGNRAFGNGYRVGCALALISNGNGIGSGSVHINRG